jgi:hypothetical protein
MNTAPITSNVVNAAAATTTVSVAATATPAGMIEVSASLYTIIAVCLALVGVYLARLVTIDAENKRLGRRQTFRETGPLTWIAVLVVCPLIWHYRVAVPWAALIGLGVGYTVRIILRLLGSTAVGFSQAMAERIIALKNAAPPPPMDIPPDMQDLLDQMDRKESE